MLITAIEPRKKSLSAVYIDGEFAMSLDTQTLLENRIEAGVEIDDEQLHKLIELSNFRRAKEKALWLLSGRDYSKKELVDKISTTCDKQAAQQAVLRMEELSLVDDERFAKKYASDLIYIKRLSRSATIYKLVQKGIDKQLAQDVVEDFEIDACEQITAVIEKKYINKLNDEKSVRRAVAALQRMGYRWSDIKSVIYNYVDESDNDF